MLTVPVQKKFSTNATVTALSSGIELSFGQKDGTLVIGESEFKISPISSMFEFPNGVLLVGTIDGLYTYHNSEQSGFKEYETGVEKITGNLDTAVIIDGLGRASVINPNGDVWDVKESSVLYSAVGKSVAIATESGAVSCYSHDGEKLWERPQRGDVGERITAIGWNDEVLVVAREGHGLVPGEEEALEVEFWTNGNLERRFDVRRRVISIDGPWMGLDMGGIMFLDAVVAELEHPVNTILNYGEYCLASCWFHLHKIEKDGIKWSVETQGMVEYVSSDSEGKSVLIGGSDQNDFTESEPVVLIDATVEAVPVVEESSSIDDWGEAPAIEIDAQELYGNEISIEDLAGISLGKQPDQSGLLDALNDEINSEQQLEDEEDLMLALSLDADEIVAPTANAGGDQFVQSSDDGTAIITLDGSDTIDPQERVISWSWVDDSGREISDSKIVKVRLPIGLHRLELRIKDKDDRWSSDSVSIRIE